MFEQRIANVPPQSRIAVTVTLVHELSVSLDGSLQFVLPVGFCLLLKLGGLFFKIKYIFFFKKVDYVPRYTPIAERGSDWSSIPPLVILALLPFMKKIHSFLFIHCPSFIFLFHFILIHFY